MDSIAKIISQGLHQTKICLNTSGPPVIKGLKQRACVHGTVCRVEDDGSLSTWMCKQCEVEKHEVQRKSEKIIEERRLYHTAMSEGLLSNDIPRRFKNKTLENYISKNPEQKRILTFCKAYLENYDKVREDGISICFCGKPGTGKTHIAYAIVQNIRQRLITAVFRTAADMTAEVKSAYKSTNHEITPETVVERYASYGLLVIDEVGMQVSSDAEKRIFFDVMNKRYLAMNPTIMISNLEKKELTDFVGILIMDRMREGGGMVFAFDWESYR